MSDPLQVKEELDPREGLELKDGLELYESGKHRRYNLLFAVNGGAFAIAKLLVENAGTTGDVLGGLTLPQLAFGMILFTGVMVYDIYKYGERMAEVVPRVDGKRAVFGEPGRNVLFLLGLLIAVGWFLVGFGDAL